MSKPQGKTSMSLVETLCLSEAQAYLGMPPSLLETQALP
jgi:hypothetical protein